MTTRQDSSGKSIEILMNGRVDGAAANNLELEIIRAIKSGAEEIFINLAEAEFICSAGIRVIMQYWRQMKGGGKKLLVTRTSPAIDQILELTGFKDSIVEKTSA
jgi:anti-sigma B factor antagonist